MKKLFFLIALLLVLPFFPKEGVFAYEVSFQEGTIASMTGKTSDVRFDVASLIYGPPTASVGYPQYDTASKKFS